jgi:tetrahydrodipicolinate N-succinyltransferase
MLQEIEAMRREIEEAREWKRYSAMNSLEGSPLQTLKDPRYTKPYQVKLRPTMNSEQVGTDTQQVDTLDHLHQGLPSKTFSPVKYLLQPVCVGDRVVTLNL